MTNTYRFYNNQGRWYIDIPEWYEAGGDEAALEMILGADTWLEVLSEGKDFIFLKISDDQKLKDSLILLESDENGSVYRAFNRLKEENVDLYLCPVTLWLFNEYPKIIYYEKA